MVTVLDYHAGNLTSVERALSRCGITYSIARVPGDLRDAERVIFPGVGNAASAMDYLDASGLGAGLKEFVATGRPFLGICLGSQIILEESHEGPVRCLGILEGDVRFLPTIAPGTSMEHRPSPGAGMTGDLALGGFSCDGVRHKVPHMGWNQAQPAPGNRAAAVLFRGVPEGSSFYFVHSFYTVPRGSTEVLCTTEYGYPFASGLGLANVVSFQFHPEKSGEPGLKILENFCSWRP